MFKKLVSNIPFNPSLIENIPEYRAILLKERKLRLLGFIILLVAFAIQLFATFFPANSALASSPNDLISGGFSSQSMADKYCSNNIDDFKNILANYSITCNDLSIASTTTFAAGSDHNGLYSLNRLSYGNSPENQVSINSHNYWVRPLWQGSGLNTVNLKALQVTSSQGTTYFVLFNSADLVFKGLPPTTWLCSDSSCPELMISVRDGSTDNLNNTQVQPGDTIIYTLSATNLSDKTINNYSISTNFSSALAYSKISNLYGGKLGSNNQISWPITNINPGQTIARNASFVVRNPVPKTPLSSTDSNYYNMKMTTVYGNAVSIKLPWNFSKYFELKINNSFPSLNIIFATIASLLLLIYVGYYLCRTELMLIELNHLKQDYLSGDKD